MLRNQTNPIKNVQMIYKWEPWSFDDPIFHPTTHPQIWLALRCVQKMQSLSKNCSKIHKRWGFAKSSYPVCLTKVIINLPYTILVTLLRNDGWAGEEGESEYIPLLGTLLCSHQNLLKKTNFMFVNYHLYLGSRSR